MHSTKSQKRATKVTRTRPYHLTKRHPRSQKAIFLLDRGNVEQQITLHFPNKTEIKDVEKSKESNPMLRSIHIGSACLIWYLDGDKGFVYDKDGTYCGSYLKHDLKNAFYRIGALLKEINHKKG